MNNLAITSPFEYIQNNLNVNLLRGISTSFIESDIFTQLPLYCFCSNCINKEIEDDKSTNFDSQEIDYCKVKIILSDAEIIEIDSECSTGKSTLSKEQDSESNTTKDDSYLENLEYIMNEFKFDKCLEDNKYKDCFKSSKSALPIKQSTLKRNKSRNQGVKRRIKYSRWGKKQDKILWKILKDLEENSKETYEMILSVSPAEAYKHDELLSFLIKKTQWRGTAEKLLERIKRMMIQSRFSYREIKRLKLMVRKGIYKNEIDISSISKEFPGKDKTIILSEVIKIKNTYKILKKVLIKDFKSNMSFK